MLGLSTTSVTVRHRRRFSLQQRLVGIDADRLGRGAYLQPNVHGTDAGRLHDNPVFRLRLKAFLLRFEFAVSG
jgi:hypothetical protein